MSFSKDRAENLLALLLWLTMSGCAATGLRTVTPLNAPPDISHRMVTDTPSHRGITIGGRGYFGHEIIAPAEGVIVFSRGFHVRIYHGADSKRHNIFTEHFHVHGRLLKEGDKASRGQNIGLIGVGKNTDRPHYHYVVVKKEGPGKFIALDPVDFWFAIDRYKKNLEKGLDDGPFVIPCFDPNVDYPKEPIRFTYPAKCK